MARFAPQGEVMANGTTSNQRARAELCAASSPDPQQTTSAAGAPLDPLESNCDVSGVHEPGPLLAAVLARLARSETEAEQCEANR
jgi:hypothetical protein